MFSLIKQDETNFLQVSITNRKSLEIVTCRRDSDARHSMSLGSPFPWVYLICKLQLLVVQWPDMDLPSLGPACQFSAQLGPLCAALGLLVEMFWLSLLSHSILPFFVNKQPPYGRLSLFFLLVGQDLFWALRCCCAYWRWLFYDWQVPLPLAPLLLSQMP